VVNVITSHTNAGDVTTGLVIRDNLFLIDNDCPVTYPSSPNSPVAVHLYSTSGALFENNDLRFTATNQPGPPKGVWFKGRNEMGTARNNYVYKFGGIYINGNLCTQGAACGTYALPYLGHGQNRVYQNVVEQAGVGFAAANFGESDFVYNNTVYNPGYGLNTGPNPDVPLINHSVFNNIIYGASGHYMRWTDDAPAGSVCAQAYFDNNIYYPLGLTQDFVDLQVSYSGLNSWQTHLATCPNPAVRETNSRRADPLFVDSGKHNFRLQPGSPARSGGRSGQYPSVIGAYVTGNETIGCTFHPACFSYGSGGNPGDDPGTQSAPAAVSGLERADTVTATNPSVE
jgi:hypothetical protein